MDLLPWPPRRELGPLAGFSQQQLEFWLETAPLDEQGKKRITDAMEQRTAGYKKVHGQANNYVSRTVKKVKRRRGADPPHPSNRAVAKTGALGFLGSGFTTTGIIAGLEFYHLTKESGILWDAVWLLSLLGRIEITFGHMVLVVIVGAVGMLVMSAWKLVK